MLLDTVGLWVEHQLLDFSNALFVQWITGQEHGSGKKQTTFPISFNEVFIAFLTQRDTKGSEITTVITKTHNYRHNI